MRTKEQVKTDYKGLTLAKAQVKEIAKNDWITLDEPTFVGCKFDYRGQNVAEEMLDISDEFCDHVNRDAFIHGADFLIVAYRPMKEDDEDVEKT